MAVMSTIPPIGFTDTCIKTLLKSWNVDTPQSIYQALLKAYVKHDRLSGVNFLNSVLVQ